MGGYKSLPFATYDLAVYLPGGAVLIVLAQYTLETVIGAPFLPNVEHFGSDTVDTVVLAILWLSSSYLAGHLGAYLSSLVVEKFVHNALSYPSTVWLKKEEYTKAGIPSQQFLRNFFRRNALSYSWSGSSVIAFIFLFPLWIPFIFFFIARPVGFYDPKLPEGLLDDVRHEFGKVSLSVEVQEGSRWEKLVEHFVANNCPLAYQRMYNYLVIYGALRLLAFIMIVAAWIIIIKSLWVFIGSTDWEFSSRRIILLSGVSFAGYFSMLAFAKFNRRFFEECVLALLLANKSPNEGVIERRLRFRSWSDTFRGGVSGR